jgi:hypothetical protein
LQNDIFVILPAVCKMSGKTNQSLSRRCVHLYEVRYSLALSLGKLYLNNAHRQHNQRDFHSFSCTHNQIAACRVVCVYTLAMQVFECNDNFGSIEPVTIMKNILILYNI